MPGPTWRRVVLLLGALVLFVPTPRVGAHPVEHRGTVVVRNLRPGFGEVISAGAVQIAAQVVADADIVTHELRMDGLVVASRREGALASHPAVIADVAVAPGDHVVQVTATDAQGRTGGRAWRFTASALPVSRISGDDRITTAVAVSRDLYPAAGSARAVVLARQDDFADALAGTPLARERDAPLLLTARDRLSAPTAAEVERVTLPGADVVVLGGPGAVADQVLSDIRALNRTPVRVAGESRFATAAAIADLLPSNNTAFIASGASFADALAASSPAAIQGAPILLVMRDAVPEPTRRALRSRSVTRAVLVGGDHVISPATADGISRETGNTSRIAGADRYETAVAVADAFFTDFATVHLATGERFPDALAGGRHAAAQQRPVLLTGSRSLPPIVVTRVEGWQPGRAVLYGGPAAVADSVGGDVRRAVLDAGGPAIRSIDPAPVAEVSSFDTVTVTFDRPLQLDSSTLYVTLGAEEVPGAVSTGDFTDTLVFTAGALPAAPPVGQPAILRITGLGYDGSRWRHVDVQLTYRKLDLSRGDTGPAVAQLQHRLTELGYWLGAADGSFGLLTHQAVLAFQKVHGLPRTGVVDAATRSALAGANRPGPRSTSGYLIEVDKARQVFFVVRNARVEWVFNTSTGTEKPYVYEGRTYLADTPPGRWRVSHEVDGVREGPLGRLYRPKYFHPDGIAIHGSSSVPAYPASHGCVRVTNEAINWMWANTILPIGTPVWIY